MKKTYRIYGKWARIAAAACIVCVLAQICPQPAKAAYSPPFPALRIALCYGSDVLPSANLQNSDGFGKGYDFGYYDANREFVSTGAWTNETAISMMMDRNMTWNAGAGGGAGEYREGTGGSVVVGCFHVQLNAGYDTFEEARTEAAKYNNAFVRYQSGKFLVLIGSHTTRTAAESAMSSLGLNGAAVNAGTSNTITVTKTGTNTVLFEFDMGTTPLGVRPRPISGEKPVTLFKNDRYNGGFSYARRDGAMLTVLNIVEIEDYVRGILPYEMSNSWPLEALKAQACCARSYSLASLNKHNSSAGADLCTTEHCQVYRGRRLANARTDQAVDETEGMYVTYQDTLCQTYYSASNGGASESVENVWTEAIPYLRGVIDPYEADIASRVTNYYWTISYTPAQITERLRSRGYSCSTIVSIVVTKYTAVGNVHTITITDSNGRKFTFSKRAQLLTALGVHSLRFNVGDSKWNMDSIYANEPALPLDPGAQTYGIDGSGATAMAPGESMYAITGSGVVEKVEGENAGTSGGSSTGLINGVFTIRGTGRGHNVGMSQWGAYSMAMYHNKDFIDIVKFYFTGVEITQTKPGGA